MDAIRSWLSTGMHTFAIDPRRRRGKHGRARRLLADDSRSATPPSGDWKSLASALDRHTVRSGMSELSPAERHVITLAYLEGRSNREIAAILGVSVSTVRRRLWGALERLDAYMRRTGTWLSALLVLVSAYAFDRALRLTRQANVLGSSDWAHRMVATVAVAATVTAVSLAAVSPDSITPGKSPASTPPEATAAAPNQGVAAFPSRITDVAPPETMPIVTSVLTLLTDPITKHAPPPVTLTPPTNGSRGCHGNPTSAAPPVPVGRHSGGSPVTHPGKGGCHA
jgi:hypothetical protein